MKPDRSSKKLSNLTDLNLQKQLMLSLKFHHREILKQLPRELALKAMDEAWYDSNTYNRFPED